MTVKRYLGISSIPQLQRFVLLFTNMGSVPKIESIFIFANILAPNVTSERINCKLLQNLLVNKLGLLIIIFFLKKE